jgi:site-specific recombinase XerD
MPEKRVAGSHGCKVTYGERTEGGPLHLFVPRKDGGYDKVSLGHRDWDVAEAEALKLAAKRRSARETTRAGKMRISTLLSRYEQEESPHKKQPGEDYRRVELWLAFFETDPETQHITKNDIKRFVRDRKAGRIKLPIVERADGKGVMRKLSSNPKATTIGADIVFLQTVLNWAVDGELIDRNPIASFKAPKTRSPLQPVASVERFLKVYRQTPHVEPTGLFRVFFGFIGEEVDWRVSVMCKLKVNDIDLRPREKAPFGCVRKPMDKGEDRARWIPLSPRGRRLMQRALRIRGAIGDVYVFEAPRVEGKPWRRQYATSLLERAEQRAELEPMEGGDFHPYRRKWSTAHKNDPWADVAEVTGRKDRKTFDRSYAKADEDTTMRVALGKRYERKAALKKNEVGPKTGPRKVGS